MRHAAVVFLFLLVAMPAAHAATPPTVAVLYFDYQGKNEEMLMLKKGLAQMLISDLSGSDAYQIVERDRLQDLIEELKLNRTKKIDKKTANKIGKLLGARYMVLGGYFDVMGTLRMDARVVEVETGRLLDSVGSHGAPDAFIDLEQKLSKGLADVLTTKLEAPAASKKTKPKRTQRKPPAKPKNLAMKTALLYSEALDAKDRGDKKTAKAKLEKVVKAQPDFSLAQLDLGAMIQ